MDEHLFNTVFCHFKVLHRIMDQVVELSTVIVKPSSERQIFSLGLICELLVKFLSKV